jgi:hypothetical protein
MTRNHAAEGGFHCYNGSRPKTMEGRFPGMDIDVE